MNTYHLKLFVPFKSSVDRFVFGLLGLGVKVESGFNNNNFCKEEESSTVIALIINSGFNFNTTLIRITNIIRDKQIPFYGFTFNQLSDGKIIESAIETDVFPELENIKNADGPYRMSGK